MKQGQPDLKQQLQEDEYDYPYHYVPAWEDGAFSQVQYWSWGFRYLGGMQVVSDQLESSTFESLIDIGCGDGRFLREMWHRHPDTELMGVDYSQRAIQMASAMNPHLKYEAINIIKERPPSRFDVATLIEVLEHIPPDQVADFCRGVADTLNEGGRLILTVPHSNKPVSQKHYQHFTSESLRSVLSPQFSDIRFVPFDVRSRFVMPLLSRLMGGAGRYFLLTHKRLNTSFYRLYERRFLYAASEQDCGRLAAVCVKRSVE